MTMRYFKIMSDGAVRNVNLKNLNFTSNILTPSKQYSVRPDNFVRTK